MREEAIDIFKNFDIKKLTKGITKRWMITTFGVILPIVIILIILLSISVKSLCYSTIEQSLSNNTSDLSNIFPGYTCDSTEIFDSYATDYVMNFNHKDIMEVEVVNSSGRVIATSTGYEHDENQKMPDYEEALQANDGYAKWIGNLNSGENVYCVTQTISNSQGTNVGAVRYLASLSKVNLRVFLITFISIIIGILIIVIIAISGGYFIQSIVKPVTEMRDTAAEIAKGNFKAKIDKQYDDEIGDLCDSINEMADELDASEKMKNDFISRVSHELRTPLTAIKGWTDTMRTGQLDIITTKKGLAIISNESERLTNLVLELLDFSKIQSGRLSLNKARIDILAEVEEAVYMFKERAKSEGKSLLYDEPDQDLPPVYGDSNRLKQVFVNILDNAIKYTPVGGMIGIEVYRDYKDDMIKVVVADNGYGISQDDLPKIKNKFYKANQKIDGSGIGLAVADEIISLHNGVLDIESAEGVGTTVTIGVPIYKESLISVDEDI